ncbi:heterogeneous nuclear ribonucleoprotein 1-like protein [Tanacetum coccineum]
MAVENKVNGSEALVEMKEVKNITQTAEVGLPPTLSEEGFHQYFETYGQVTDVVVMYDQQTNRPRGFGFISFDSEDAVDWVLHNTLHDFNDNLLEHLRFMIGT